MSDRRIDPVTRDFVTAAGGAFEECDVIENQIAAAFSIAKGSWEGDPEFGHRFDELDGEKNTVENRRKAEQFAVEAVEFLLRDGSLERAVATVEEYNRTGIAFQLDAYLPGSTQRLPLERFFVPLGASR